MQVEALREATLAVKAHKVASAVAGRNKAASAGPVLAGLLALASGSRVALRGGRRRLWLTVTITGAATRSAQLLAMHQVGALSSAKEALMVATPAGQAR